MPDLPIRLTIVYYSATGTVHALAEAAAAAGEQAGAQVRLRRVRETAPDAAVQSRPAWAEHARATADVAEAVLDDVDWADAVAIGTPTRFGLPASQVGAFLDSTGPLWQAGRLADKVCGAFTASGTTHGGQESTLLALGHVFAHWGGILVPPGYTDPVMYESGRPYGAGLVQGTTPEVELRTVHHQVRRMVQVAAALRAGGWRADAA